MHQHLENFIAMHLQTRCQTKEVPSFAVLTTAKQEIVSWSWNQKETSYSVLQHAEICVIEAATRKLKCVNLKNYQIITTIEPCMMCLGAILEANIKDIIYYLSAPKTGFLVSNHTINLNNLRVVQHNSRLNPLISNHMQRFFRPKEQ